MIKINNKKIESWIFNGGECHVRIDPKGYGELAEVEAFLYNANDIMFLLLTIDAIRQIKKDIYIKLVIPYFPYGRQDRVCIPGESFSLKVMANMINSLDVADLTIYDPHSKMTNERLFSRATEVSMASIFQAYSSHIRFENTILVSPDAGAEKKTKLLGEVLKLPVIYCSKVRNPENGEIKGVSTPDNLGKNKNYLIADDICDGGRTFIELAKAFNVAKIGQSQLQLYVTHGIFSKGIDQLIEYFNHIYCYHAFPEFLEYGAVNNYHAISLDRTKKYLTILNQKDKS